MIRGFVFTLQSRRTCCLLRHFGFRCLEAGSDRLVCWRRASFCVMRTHSVRRRNVLCAWASKNCFFAEPSHLSCLRCWSMLSVCRCGGVLSTLSPGRVPQSGRSFPALNARFLQAVQLRRIAKLFIETLVLLVHNATMRCAALFLRH